MSKLGNFAKGKFNMKNPDKYLGNKTPVYRSSWEFVVMNMLDNHPSIVKWASEAIRIPYNDPITGRATTYVPDFFVSFVDKDNKKRNELWEIKPACQTFKEQVGKSKYNQVQYIKNQVKWTVATEYCKRQNIIFRVISEEDIFMLTKNKKK